MSAVDLAWWRMEEGEGTATVGGALTFQQHLSRSTLCELVETRILKTYPRFRRRVVASKGETPRWSEDPDFSLDYHIDEVAVDAEAGEEPVRRMASRLMNEGLDGERPPWRMWLLQHSGAGSTLLILFHHCLGDGFALARALLEAADGRLGEADAGGADGRDDSVGLLSPVVQLWNGTGRVAERARQVGRWFQDVIHLLALPFERPTTLTNSLTGDLRVAWSQRVPLANIKDIGRAYEGTVNDVLLTAVAGAVRRHLAEQGEPVDDFDLRCVVPVNLRSARRIEQMPPDLGNQFGLVFLELPTGASSPRARMDALQEDIERLKRSGEPAVSFGILWMLGHLPPVVERIFNVVFGRKASMVVSNVPGPASGLSMGGVDLSNLMFWVPHPAGLGLGISLISYDGGVCIGVRADTGVLDNPIALVDEIETQLDEMHRHASDTPRSSRDE